LFPGDKAAVDHYCDIITVLDYTFLQEILSNDDQDEVKGYLEILDMVLREKDETKDGLGR